MKIFLIFFFLIYTYSFLFSEVIILENGKKIIGKIIKMDADTITVLTQNSEMVLDRDKIISIYRSEQDYNESVKKENQ